MDVRKIKVRIDDFKLGRKGEKIPPGTRLIAGVCKKCNKTIILRVGLPEKPGNVRRACRSVTLHILTPWVKGG